MGPSYTALLLAVTFLVSVEVAATSQTTRAHDTIRLLRSHKSTIQEEERGISATGLESLVNSLKSKVSTEQLSALAKKSESTDDVFKLLTIDKKADDLLGSTQLDDWIAYMKIFNKENHKQQTSLVTTLLAHYGDDGVAKMVEAAKTVPKAATMAKKLQTEQIALWLEAAKTPDDIFKLLKLDKAGDKLFMSPEVNAWMNYIDRFNNVNREMKTTMYSKLSAAYQEKPLVTMLIAAKNTPITEKIASRVQAQQTQHWLKSAKSPDDIFTLLKLDDAEESLLQNPLFNAWTKYIDDFNLMHPKKESLMIYTLMDYYAPLTVTKMILEAKKISSTQSMAKRLNLELFTVWKLNGNTPSYVFSLLKLGREGGNLFESPLFVTWLQYINFLKNKKPRTRVDVLSILRNNFAHDTVAEMLIKGTKVPGVRKIASDLQDNLLLKWFKAKTDPAKVLKWLRVDDTAENSAAKELYDAYIKLFDMVKSTP